MQSRNHRVPACASVILRRAQGEVVSPLVQLISGPSHLFPIPQFETASTQGLARTHGTVESEES